MQDPYTPGENNRLPWINDVEKRGAPLGEEGGIDDRKPGRPMLVFVYGPDMGKDCCASNFERSVFRYRPVIELASAFDCVKRLHGDAGAVPEGVALEVEKPAIVLLDGEGTLIHKQQRCVDPKAYAGILREALTLNERRFKQRDASAAKLAEACRRREAKEYRQALKLLDGLLGRKIELTQQVAAGATTEREAVVAAGRALLDGAAAAKAAGRLEEAIALYRKVRQEFAAAQDLHREAVRGVTEVEGMLKRSSGG